MSYIEQNLMPNEKIEMLTELHWIIFFWPLVFTALLIAFMFKQHFLFILNYAAVILIVYLLGSSFIRYLTTFYAVTSSRVILKQGFLFVRSWDISIAKIESVQLQQSLLGKIFDYADIVVNGVGGDRMVFQTVEEPMIFRQKLFELMGALK